MRWWWLAIVLGGCNQLLGIEQTAPMPPPDGPPDMYLGPLDEDGDGYKDSDDNCPADVNPDQTLDGDGDGVGDACDPHPTTPGDRIVAAEMFNGPQYTWTPDSTTSWQIVKGSLQASPVTVGLLRRLTFATTAAHPTLQMQFHIDGYSRASINSIDVAVTTPGSYMHTLMRGTSIGEDLFVAELMDGGAIHASISFTPQGIPEGSTNAFEMTRDQDITYATLDGRSGIASVQTSDPNLSAVIEVQDMQISIAYIVLYASP